MNTRRQSSHPGTKESANLVSSYKILEESCYESWQHILARYLVGCRGSCLGSYLVNFLQALAIRSCKNSSKIL